MRTYRLQFSDDQRILERRLEKAKASRAERILALGFEKHPPLREKFNGIWALETSVTNQAHELHAGWDQRHTTIQTPDHSRTDLLSNPTDCIVIQPTHLTVSKWVPWMKQFSDDELQTKVFLECFPWHQQSPATPTVHEVSNFLYALKFHFPNWTPKRRPGVEMWDFRIPDSFELEAGLCQQEQFYLASEKPEISVIIPSYNNKYFAYRALKHLGAQNIPYGQFEVIIIDDGGTDHTLDYLRTFGTPVGMQVRYVYWPRPRLRDRGDSFFRAGLCRNLGARWARGSKIVFLDSDILVSEGFLSKVSQGLETSDVLQFPRVHIRQERSQENLEYKQFQPDDFYIEEKHYWEPFFKSLQWMKLENFWKYTCTYALAMKSQDFWMVGGFRRFYVSYGFEDTELGYRLAKMNKKFHLIQEPVLHLTSYSQSEYQLSQAKRQKLLRKTAKQFFLSTMDLEVYHHLQSLMAGDFPWWDRLRRHLGLKDRTIGHGDFS